MNQSIDRYLSHRARRAKGARFAFHSPHADDSFILLHCELISLLASSVRNHCERNPECQIGATWRRNFQCEPPRPPLLADVKTLQGGCCESHVRFQIRGVAGVARASSQGSPTKRHLRQTSNLTRDLPRKADLHSAHPDRTESRSVSYRCEWHPPRKLM